MLIILIIRQINLWRQWKWFVFCDAFQKSCWWVQASCSRKKVSWIMLYIFFIYFPFFIYFSFSVILSHTKRTFLSALNQSMKHKMIAKNLGENNQLFIYLFIYFLCWLFLVIHIKFDLKICHSRFVVRDFVYDEEEMAASKNEISRLTSDKKKLFVRESILAWIFIKVLYLKWWLTDGQNRLALLNRHSDILLVIFILVCIWKKLSYRHNWIIY